VLAVQHTFLDLTVDRTTLLTCQCLFREEPVDCLESRFSPRKRLTCSMPIATECDRV
jgi:hypothetical protein